MGLVEGGLWKIAGKAASWLAPELGLAVAGTKMLKGMVDSETARLLQEVRELEGCPHVKAMSEYGTGHVKLLAPLAAKAGKTSWEAPNTLWVYHDQVDYAPIHARQVYHLRSDGKFEGQGGGWGKKVTGGPCKMCGAAHSARK